MELGKLADWVREELLDFFSNSLDVIPTEWPGWALLLVFMPWLVEVVFVILLVPVLGRLFWVRSVTRNFQHWDQKEGTIVDAYVKTEKRGEGMVYPAAFWFRDVYVPVIHYEYLVSGRRYQSTRVGFTPKEFDLDGAKEYLKDFEPGNNVIVYVKPGKPGVCFLEPGRTEEYWDVVLRYGLGIVLLFVGYVALKIWLRANELVYL